MAMEEYETEKWLKQHPHTEIYKIAINLLEQIKEEENNLQVKFS
ncbi:hypothetical protein ACLBR5_31620 [Escherichia coli]